MASVARAAISTEELLRRREDGTSILVDLRSVDAYNGWTLRDEPRGGHIAGARSLPAKWAEYIDWIEVVRSKGMDRGRSIVLYGYNDEQTERIARRFDRSGFGDVLIYPHFLSEWVPDESLPMEKLPRWWHLVPPAWLNSRIQEGRFDVPDGGHVLCHAHYRNPGDYSIGHIPGALPLDTNQLESPQTWSRRSPEELADALADLGITADSTVVLYGRCSHATSDDPFPGSSAGHLAAFRCALILLYAGVKDVRILNGGLQSWQDEGYLVTDEPSAPYRQPDFGCRIPSSPEYIIDLPEAREVLASDAANLVSVRSWPEFIGEVSGYNYIDKKGRIPGAVFGNCGSDAYHMENYRNLDHTSRESGEIEGFWAEAGITPDKYNAFYCGTGWRASEAFFSAWFMKWPRVSVYDGGWFEWSRNHGNPIEMGPPD